MRFFCLFTVPLLLLVSGCGLTGEVTSFSGSKTLLDNIKVSNRTQTLLVIDGEATRNIKLKEIDILTILPYRTRTFDGVLFYQVRLQLKNGTKIGFDAETRNGAIAYISLDNTLMGKSGKSTYSVSMDKMSEIDLK